MDLKNRRMLMGGADIGELPAGLSFVSFRKPTTSVATIAHGLGVKPDIVMIFPNAYDVSNDTGANNPQMLFASSGNSAATGYDGKLVNNYIASAHNWDYTSNQNYGWNADETNVEIKLNSSNQWRYSDTWYMLSVKFN